MNNVYLRRLERVMIAAPILMSVMACGNLSRGEDQKEHAAPRDELQQYYAWIYQNPPEVADRRNKLTALEEFLQGKDVFRMNEDDMQAYSSLCAEQKVPEDVCAGVLKIQQYLRAKSDDSCSKNGCGALSCGVTAC